MLKVHSLFPENASSRQVAIQTQYPTNMPNIQYNSQVFKNWKLQDSLKQYGIENQKYSLTQSYNSYGVSKITKMRKFRINKKENFQMADHKSKIQATKFNFIKFEDKFISQAIKKYIKQMPLNKLQNQGLRKKIQLFYIIEDQSSQNMILRRKISQCEKMKPISTSIKQIIENVVNLSQQERDAKGHIKQSQIKRIQREVQKIVALKQPIKVAKLQNSQNKSNVRTVVESYIKNIRAQSMKPVFNKKGYLQRFYEQIFIRYENNPFIQQLQGGNIFKQDPEEQINHSKSTINSIDIRGRSQNFNVFTPKISLFCSQKGNYFENNLRKQMRNLAEQSQKIVLDQNKKVSKF